MLNKRVLTGDLKGLLFVLGRYANTNSLQQVTDNTAYSSYYSEDVDHQAGVYNYYYDYSGNLIGDVAEKITNISWTVYGKIASIVKNGATISYSYDAAGNRITKTAGGITTLYVRDASGNVMSVYELPAANTILQKEVHLYGSSRVGIVKVDNEVVERIPLSGGGDMVIRKQVRGNKLFETTNHLGNVLATVTDRKLLQSSTEQAGINNGGCQPGTAVEELTVMQRGTASQFTARTAVYLGAGFETVDAVDELEVNTSTQQTNCVALPPATISNGQAWYVADVVSATDYAPFGMALVGRSYSSEKYRYGFNGKEMDKDMHSQTAYDYGFRIYNPGIGKFFSVDPLFKGYPWNSPYSYAEGDVIRSIDLDGKEKAIVTDDGTIEIQLVYVAFTNRPSKVIDGKEYSGGSLPSNLNASMAVKVFNKGYEEINNGLNGKEFAIKPVEYAKQELSNGLYFGAKKGEIGDKTSKVRYNAKLLVFTDEDEMRKSNEYQQALVNNTMSGYQLYGENSYGKIGVNANSEQPIIRDPDAWGQSFGSGTTPNKAIMIDPIKGNGYPMQAGNAYYRSTLTHEHGHQLGLPHILPDDPISGGFGSSLVPGDKYNGIGLMKGLTGNHKAKAEAPFLSQILKILNSINFEKPATSPAESSLTQKPNP